MGIYTQQVKTKTNYKNIMITLILVVVFGVVLTFLGKKIFDKIREQIRQKKAIDKANNEIIDTQITLTPAQIQTYADKLYSAMRGWGTDEPAIFNTFGFIRTRSDLLEIKKVFGIKSGKTLDEWLTAELSQKDIDKVNQILISNRINYSFFNGL